MNDELKTFCVSYLRVHAPELLAEGSMTVRDFMLRNIRMMMAEPPQPLPPKLRVVK